MSFCDIIMEAKGVLVVTEEKLIEAIAAAIENNSAIEGEADDSLLFKDVVGLTHNKKRVDVEFAGGKKFQIVAVEA